MNRDMRNRYKGKCELCDKVVLPKQGRYRMGEPFVKQSQNFQGLRCLPCSTTTKKGLKLTAIRLKTLTKE